MNPSAPCHLLIGAYRELLQGTSVQGGAMEQCDDFVVLTLLAEIAVNRQESVGYSFRMPSSAV
jgi:hypothetical protein